MAKRRRGSLLRLFLVAVLVTIAAVAAVKVAGLRDQPRTVTIGVDLPFQGASASASDQTWNAMRAYLDSVGGKAGTTTVTLLRYDDSTTAKGTWDEATCTRNANAHLARADEVAVIGPQHVGCARAEAKILAGAGMVLVSPAVTNPGLTRAWGPGEPDAYAAGGVRSFARVVPTDDAQAAAAARYAAVTLGVKSCLVLDDGELYGRQLAQRFADEADRKGVDVASGRSWDRTHASYLELFTGFADVADCVYLAGNFDNNGAQLVADKLAALGGNERVKLLVPDGFGGYPAFTSLPAADGAYTTTSGLTLEAWRSGEKARAFLTAYQARYHTELTSAQALYGVLALQAVLRAVESSDGTRAGVHQAVFGGSGVTVPVDICLTGAPLAIVPASGDVAAPDITIGQVKAGVLGYLARQPLT